jgi:integrase
VRRELEGFLKPVEGFENPGQEALTRSDRFLLAGNLPASRTVPRPTTMPTNNIAPITAKDRYLKDRQSELTDKSLYNYNCSLKRLCEYLDQQNIRKISQITPDILQSFKEHRMEKVATITLRNDLRVVKLFIEFCESLGAITPGTHELIRIPEGANEVNTTYLTQNEAEAALDYLWKYEYASAKHVVFYTLWKCGMRLSGLRTLDLEDFDPVRPALEIRHRPETGTPLKNKDHSERDVFISEDHRQLLSDYIAQNRPDETDEYGRKPLFATVYGRRSRGTIQSIVYGVTRPCVYTNECPVEKDPDTCEHNTHNRAYGCPESVSPHALRKGYVTAAATAGQPRDVTQERTNMSDVIMSKHYDMADHAEKAERRKDSLFDV